MGSCFKKKSGLVLRFWQIKNQAESDVKNTESRNLYHVFGFALDKTAYKNPLENLYFEFRAGLLGFKSMLWFSNKFHMHLKLL